MQEQLDQIPILESSRESRRSEGNLRSEMANLQDQLKEKDSEIELYESRIQKGNQIREALEVENQKLRQYLERLAFEGGAESERSVGHLHPDLVEQSEVSVVSQNTIELLHHISTNEMIREI